MNVKDPPPLQFFVKNDAKSEETMIYYYSGFSEFDYIILHMLPQRNSDAWMIEAYLGYEKQFNL